MKNTVEINRGELRLKFNEPIAGKVSFADLGLKDEDLVIESGFMRLLIDIEDIGEHSYFQVPTFEITYKENLAETHWQCDFNRTTILDKTDNHGNSTVILMDRKKIENLEHHHENKLILHAEFPETVHISAADSYLNLFK
ncbi:MAG: hypothetical protein AB8B72_08605 [Crocinitomicaceae bacterium]